MKKMGILATLGLCTLILAPSVHAEDKTAATKGDVLFTSDETVPGGKPVIPEDGGGTEATPGPNENGDQEDGSHTSGALRLEFVSNFHFGEQKNSSVDQRYAAEFPKATMTDGTVIERAPIFAQVTDERGEADGRWDLSISQTKKFTKTKMAKKAADGSLIKDKNGKYQYENVPTSQQKRLENTQIFLYNAQYFNTVAKGDIADEIKGLITPVQLDGTDGTAIPFNTDLTLMSVKSGKSTNGTKTSIVFSGKELYDASKNINQRIPENAKNTDVKLFVPGSDVTEHGAFYESEFMWTLSDTK